MAQIWENAANSLYWDHKWNMILDCSDPTTTKWFSGGKLNICYNVVDRHANGNYAHETAVICESFSANTSSSLSYQELLEKISRFAGALQNLGMEKGDSIVLFVPSIIEAVVAYLASLRIGLVASCWAFGVAIPAMVTRIDILKPKIVITADYGSESKDIFYYKETLDKVLSLTKHQPKHCIVIQRPNTDELVAAHLNYEKRDLDWETLIRNSDPCEYVPLEANEPALIAYTSGTNSEGKAMVFTTGGLAVICALYFRNQWENCKILFHNVPLGWLPGPTATLLGPLLFGKTTVIYEGDPLTPDPGIYFRIIARHNADCLLVNIGSLRALVLEDPSGEYPKKYPCKSLRSISAGGETCGENIQQWVIDNFNLPLQLIWGQTEVGGLATTGNHTIEELSKLPVTCVGKPLPGFDVRILDDNGCEVPQGVCGNIAIKTPLPPGCAITIFNDHARYRNEYFTLHEGYYNTKDIGEILGNGSLNCIGRSDTIVKIAEARICLSEIEDAIKKHINVLEVLAVSVKHEEQGHHAVAFYTVKNRTIDDISMRQELIALVDDNVGPESTFKYSFRVNSIPKMKMTGKIARNIATKFLSENFPQISKDMSTEEIYATMESITNNCELFN